MKKLIMFFAACVMTLFAAAQNVSNDENATSVKGDFEGEIAYETYENYSKYILKMPNSIYVNGVHKMRLIVKGDKTHVIDETTGCHTIYDNSATAAYPGYTLYCELTKTGFNMKKYDFMMVAAPRTLDYGYMGQTAPLTANTFASTGKKSEILGNECTLWEGDIVHNMGGMTQTYSCHAYCTDIPATEGYRNHLLGMPLNDIAAKWIVKYDGGHVAMMGVGELSYYQEGDVISITPRSVSDNEFTIPSEIKVTKGSIRSSFKMMGFFHGIKKALEKAGIKGGSNDAKSTGVHFKTQDEWDF